MKKKTNTIRLRYIEEDNIIVDDDGHIVYDIFSYITPNQLMFLKKRRASYTFKRFNNSAVRVVYVYDMLSRICDMYKHG